MDRNLDKMLSQLVEEIERVEVTRQQFGNVMRQIKGGINLGRFPAIAGDISETTFTTKISPISLAGLRIAGVDGGLVRRRFRSMDLILTRSVAVVFQFGPKEGPEVDFYPEPFPEPKVRPVLLTLSGAELDQLASLERMAAEVKVALSILEEFDALDIILMDGSLFYHPRDRPQSGSTVYEKFQEVLALYRLLYNRAREKGTMLVGIVKDSRSSRITNIMGDILPHIIREPAIFEKMQGVDYRWLVKNSRDCDILDTFLDEGERTFAFRYSTELTNNSNAFTDEMAPWASAIWVTYLKTAQDDLPVRVEMLTPEGNDLDSSKFDTALAVILPLSCQHPEYGIPAPILEADTRAKISMNETQLIVDRLMALSGLTYTTLEKRRSRNPFGG